MSQSTILEQISDIIEHSTLPEKTLGVTPLKHRPHPPYTLQRMLEIPYFCGYGLMVLALRLGTKMTLKEIGCHLGITQERVRQYEAVARKGLVEAWYELDEGRLRVSPGKVREKLQL